MKTIQEKQNTAFNAMKASFGYKNRNQAPRLVKVVISVGTGKAKDPKKNDLVMDRLAKITGQKPAMRGAKKSIASFKVRQGDPVGVTVTLRGERMRKFLDKLINVAIPRMKDFRGLNRSAIDELGNVTLGIKEHTIFTETSNEDLKDVFGMAITIVTTAINKKEAENFFELLGMPFKKKEEGKK
ncbi:50S ribosomal protein L5 [bacterium]|nr:50S ribosomal protein L5 [bacterium]